MNLLIFLLTKCHILSEIIHAMSVCIHLQFAYFPSMHVQNFYDCFLQNNSQTTLLLNINIIPYIRLIYLKNNKYFHLKFLKENLKFKFTYQKSFGQEKQNIQTNF